MDLPALLDQMKAAVESHPTGELNLGWRIRLWSAMQDAFGEESQWRRDVLALVVARELKPIVTAFQFKPKCPKDVQRLGRQASKAIEKATLYLGGDLPLEGGLFVLRVMQDYSDNVTFYLANLKYQAVFLAIVALLPRFTRVDDAVYTEMGWYRQAWNDDQFLQIIDGAAETLEVIETHRLAASAACCTDDEHCIDSAKENIALRRTYWRDWVDRVVPYVLGPIEDVRSLLE